MGWQTEEKRVSIRYPYTRPVSYMALGESGRPPDKVAVHGEILNLSSGGMRIRTERQALEEGTVLQVWFPLSEPPVTIPVLAQVRWVREEMPGEYQVGLRFMI
ncbi:MAG: PilZ domain-containing protein [Nitrospirae bacterium]|nr:PilZ domain-containing protein [Nitrospirota bacterium]OIP58646.1 MAG: hypothetical protein AUK38_07640 [Nitrospirae bacterium CG2_30_41_42]